MTTPSDPAAVMSIRKITANITTFSAPFSRFGLFKIGGRGTLGMPFRLFPPSPLYQLIAPSPPTEQHLRHLLPCRPDPGCARDHRLLPDLLYHRPGL